MKAEFKGILWGSFAIFLVGAAIGLTLNHKLVWNAFTGTSVVAPVADTSDEKQAAFPIPVGLDEVRTLISEGALLVDARAEEIYAEGRIKGALSLPFAEVEEALSSFRKQVDLNTPLITYCSGYGCPDSFDLGSRLLTEGFTDVYVYEGGYPEWRDSGLDVEEGAQ